jgi:hypothetical protein
MKNGFNYLTIFIICSLLGCHDVAKKANYGLIEFKFLNNEIKKGKILIYKKIGNESQFYTSKFEIIKENGKSSIIKCNYYKNYITDSIKMSMSGELLEIYNFELLHKIDLNPLKAKIIKNEIFITNNKFNKRISKFQYQRFDKKIVVDEHEKYLYDTIVQKNGLNLKCLVTKTKIQIKFNSKNIEISKEILYKKTYYAKGQGVFCYIVDKKDESSMWIQI